MALHTLNCSVSSPSFPQISPRDTRPCLFQSSYPELNPHKRNSQITRSKISYSFIEPQPLPCTADCDYQFHTLVVNPSPRFTLTLVGSAFGIFVVDVWRISKCNSVRRFPPLGLHKGVLNYRCLLILLIHTKHKNNKMRFCTDPVS